MTDDERPAPGRSHIDVTRAADAEGRRSGRIGAALGWLDERTGIAPVVRAGMRKVFPDRSLDELPLSHPVFSSFFEIREVVQVPNRWNGCSGGRTWERPDDTEPRIYGIADDDGRLMVLVTYNSDLGDAWEYLDLPCYPAEIAVRALQMGVNFMVYAMTH